MSVFAAPQTILAIMSARAGAVGIKRSKILYVGRKEASSPAQGAKLNDRLLSAPPALAIFQDETGPRLVDQNFMPMPVTGPCRIALIPFSRPLTHFVKSTPSAR